MNLKVSIAFFLFGSHLSSSMRNLMLVVMGDSQVDQIKGCAPLTVNVTLLLHSLCLQLGSPLRIFL